MVIPAIIPCTLDLAGAYILQSIHTNCLPPTEQTQFCVLVCRMLATAAELMRYDNTRGSSADIIMVNLQGNRIPL